MAWLQFKFKLKSFKAETWGCPPMCTLHQHLSDVRFVVFFCQRDSSSVMGRCGGDSGASPWPRYVPLAWPKAPRRRASARRVDICRRQWRWRKVDKQPGDQTKCRRRKTNGALWPKLFIPLFQARPSTLSRSWTMLCPTSSVRLCLGDGLTTVTTTSRACWRILQTWPIWKDPSGL